MRKGGGKAKGASFEREVCKELSLWVSQGAREDLYWRSAMSGGRATVGRRKGKDHAAHAGDISATHPDGHALTDRFYLECKHYRDLNFSGLLKGNGKLIEFWQITRKEAAAVKKLPMLIFRQNLFKTMVGLNYEGVQTFNLKPYLRVIACYQNLHILPLTDLTQLAEWPW